MKKGSRLVCFLLLCFWITGCQREEHCINRKQALEEKMNLCTVPPTETPSVSNTLQMTPLPKLTPIPGTTVAPSQITMLPEQTPPDVQEEETVDITICFTGDISLAEDAPTMKQWENSGKNLEQCISPELLFLMNAADVLCINNEFTFTTRGTPLADKTYTFRANPERVALLLEMGVDVALLANNHVYDYGKVSLLDTLDTMLLQLHITGKKDKLLVETEIIPARQENNCTHFLAELEEQQEVYEYLERISINVEIDEQGTVKEKQEN